MKCFALLRVFGQQPGLLVVDVQVGFVGQMHDLAHSASAIAGFIRRRDFGQCCIGDDAVKYVTIRHAKDAVKLLADKSGTTAGDVDVLADQITVHLGDEIIKVEVDVFHRAIKLAGKVVT